MTTHSWAEPRLRVLDRYQQRSRGIVFIDADDVANYKLGAPMQWSLEAIAHPRKFGMVV